MTKRLKGVGNLRKGPHFVVNTTRDPRENQNSSDVLPKPENSPIFSIVVTKGPKSDPFTIWHHRLGYASLSKLQLVEFEKPHIKENSSLFVTCPLSKFTKLSFPISESRASAPFELIHIDIWGPYRECTRGKFRYFLTIVDDYSRSTWVYLLEYKSQALETLLAFKHYVETHFQRKIKFIRFDNAPEFDIDEPCKKFFISHGIVRQTSCVKRPIKMLG